MREYGSNINLPSLDNLFSSEQERQDAKLEKIQIWLKKILKRNFKIIKLI